MGPSTLDLHAMEEALAETSPGPGLLVGCVLPQGHGQGQALPPTSCVCPPLSVEPGTVVRTWGIPEPPGDSKS